MSQVDPNSTTGGEFVQFPDDSTNTGKKIVYLKETIDDVVVYIPTTVMVDDSGNILNLGSALEVETAKTLTLLRAIILRLDILNSAVSASYSPPDQLAEDPK